MPVKRGSNSMKVEPVSGSYAHIGVGHDFSPAADWSSYDFLTFWLYAREATGKIIRVRLITTIGTDYYDYEFTQDWAGWRRVVLPLRKPTATYGSPTLSSIVRMLIYMLNVDGDDVWWLDRGGVDVGNTCLLYTSPSPRDLSTSRMPSSA